VSPIRPRYGVRIRRRVHETRRTQVRTNATVRGRCSPPAITGVWECRHSVSFRGRAYRPIVTTSFNARSKSQGKPEPKPGEA